MVEIAQGEVWWAELLDIVAIDRAFLADRVARLGPKQLAQILHGIDVVLGR
jgi:hypothetical protein